MNIFSKGKENQIKEKSEYNLNDIAIQLGVDERIAENYNFLMDFKQIVVYACHNSKYNDLYNKVEKDRLDLEMAKDIKLNKDETKRLIDEIKENYSIILSEKDEEEWRAHNTPEDDEEEVYDAIRIDKQTGSVYFQHLSQSGKNVFRESEITKNIRYKTNETEGVVKDTLYDYPGYSTGYHEVFGSRNEYITRKQINYSKRKVKKVLDIKHSFNNNPRIMSSADAIDYNDIKSDVTPNDNEER